MRVTFRKVDPFDLWVRPQQPSHAARCAPLTVERLHTPSVCPLSPQLGFLLCSCGSSSRKSPTKTPGCTSRRRVPNPCTAAPPLMFVQRAETSAGHLFCPLRFSRRGSSSGGWEGSTPSTCRRVGPHILAGLCTSRASGLRAYKSDAKFLCLVRFLQVQRHTNEARRTPSAFTLPLKLSAGLRATAAQAASLLYARSEV